MSAGANFYLTKPVRPKDLEEMARLLTGTSMPMTTLLERFIPEAREYLESAAAGLLKLERDAVRPRAWSTRYSARSTP